MNQKNLAFVRLLALTVQNPDADVAAWMIEEELYWKALTEKGEA